MYMWIYLSITLTCLYGIFWSWHWRARKHFRHLPTLSQLPFIGTMHWFINGSEAMFSYMLKISKLDLPSVIWVGPLPMICVTKPMDVKAVSNAFLQKPYLYNFAHDWLGGGLLLAPVEMWKRNRKAIAGIFTGSMVAGFQEVFNVQGQLMSKKFKMKVGEEPFDILPHISLVALEAIFRCSLGAKYCSNNTQTQKYHKALHNALELLIKRSANLVCHFDCVYRLTEDYKKYTESLVIMRNLSDQIIHEILSEIKFMNRSSSSNRETKFKTILDILLELSKHDSSMTESRIKAEMVTLFVGATDTVATTFSLITVMLGTHPDVQEKLYEEVKAVFANNNTIDKEALASLVYCEAIVAETLRMYPSLPVVARHADCDLELESCKIPKGTMCTLNLWGVGRSEREWGPDADQFKPERWLPPFKPNHFAYMPFSFGKRSCIGKKYAFAFLKTVLAYCARDLVFVSKGEPLELKFDMILKATKGNLLQVKLR